MSLIPYHARDGREIVLRHHNAIVVRDPSSQRLEIRGLTECPTCHQPLRSASPERHFDAAPQRETYVDPDYFRMLRAGNGRHYGHVDHPPSSPIRRLVEPFSPADDEVVREAEFVSSAPAVQEGGRIRRESFSPNYFNTFFVEERELGRGGKGVVLLVRHEIDGCQLGHFACKRVPVGNDHAWLEKVLVEVELLAKLSHPNLVSYRHVWLEDVQLTRFGPSVACAFILQQYCNSGDLHHYVLGDQPKEATKEELKAQMRRRSKGQAERPQCLFAAQRRLQFEEIYSLFKDITSGLAYLHAANYIHRDLKPSNCLLHREGNHLACLISDFGEVQPETAVRKSTGATGTISYCAPEVLRKDSTGRYGNFTTKSDIFSLGMILYFMCFGRLPYQSANAVQEELEDIDQLRAEITHWKGFQDERRERPDLPSKLYQLLKRLLALNPLERPNASEVLGAMKTDGSLDGAPRVARSASPSLGQGRRIQSLDSPMPPSTPIPGSSPPSPRKAEQMFTSFVSPHADPSKHAKVASSSDEDVTTATENGHSSRPTFSNSFQNHTIPTSTSSAARHRHTHSMSLTRSQDGYSRSPDRGRDMSTSTPGLSLDRSRSLDLDMDEHDREIGHTHPLTTPPLLMAPPTTFVGDLRHRAAVIVHRAGQDAERLTFMAKLGLFFFKMATLSQVCWPYSVGRLVGASLISVAAVELVVPWVGGDDPRLIGGMATNPCGVLPEGLHMAGLATNPTIPHFPEDDGGSGTHEDHATMSAAAAEIRPRITPRTTSRRAQTGAWRVGGWAWDWRVRVLLLLLHYLILGVTSRYGALCAVPEDEKWSRW